MTTAKSTPDPLAATSLPADVTANRRDLFLVGFLVLFLELACIRWFGAYVIFLQFFTNLILIACFLGMSIGCACARQPSPWLARFPWLSLATMGLAVGLNELYRQWEGLAIDIGRQRESPTMIFFGTESRDIDLAQFVIPVEWIAGVFFVLVTLMFIGLGQVLGRCFDRAPNRVMAYTANIGGSLAGIAGFAAMSFLRTPPIVWFVIGWLGVAYLLKQAGQLNWPGVLGLVLTAGLVLGAGISWDKHKQHYWTPYYWLTYDHKLRDISVNNIGHQRMVTRQREGELGAVYSLIHLLQRDAGRPPFEQVMIIGAGSGNDVAHSLQHGVRQVDAVEIDPVIQRLGQQYHPDRPYDDPRVQVHLDDGRSFLRRTGVKYDLIVYGVVDSLIMHSSFSNVRLESFLFTKQAFADIKRALNPAGVFVTYNYFRKGWIVDRIVQMLEQVFEQEPIVISVPYIPAIRGNDDRGMTIVIAGHTAPLAAAFAEHQVFWLNRKVALHAGISAFGPQPPQVPDVESSTWNRIAPSVVVPSVGTLGEATDDWPFLYLRLPMVPWLYGRGTIMLGVLGLVILMWLSPGHKLVLNGRMFFLGAAFMLLETKAVVHLALVFGSTWVVKSLVFAAILVMILGANLYVLWRRRIQLSWHYAALFTALVLNTLVPFDIFLDGGVLWKYVAPCVLTMSPMFFAGVIFAVTFQQSKQPDVDFGANIAGAVIGGFSEYLSMLLGFRNLLFVAIAYYALSALGGRRR